MLGVIFACNEEGLIGQNNAIPWTIKQDLKFFRLTTENNIVIMGRKTFESIGKPLENRINIVVTSKNPLNLDDNLYFSKDFESALALAKMLAKDKDIFVIGGKELIEKALPICDEVYRTLVFKKYPKTDSDVYVSREFENFMNLTVHMPGEENGILFFIDYFNKKPE